MEQRNLLNLDLPKSNFLGKFEMTDKNGVTREFAKIKYAKDQTFNVLASNFKKCIVNEQGGGTWAENQEVQSEGYDFIRISLNPDKIIKVAVNTGNLNSEAKPIFKYADVQYSTLLSHFEKERKDVTTLKQNKKQELQNKNQLNQNNQKNYSLQR